MLEKAVDDAVKKDIELAEEMHRKNHPEEATPPGDSQASS